jgi:hypothetical protein
MSRPSTVPLQKVRIAVQQSFEQLKAETLRWEKVAPNDAQVRATAEYVRTHTKQLHQRLADALDKAFTEKDDKKAAFLYGQAAKTAGEIDKDLKSNPKIVSLKNNPVFSIHAVDAVRGRISDLIKHLD